MINVTTVILAAGRSSRFKHSKSKIFQDLAGSSVIDHIYKIAKKISHNNVIFVCNNQNIKDLKNNFPNAKFVLQKQQLGTAHALISAKKYLKKSNILILFADAPLITLSSIKKLIKDYYKNNSIGSMIAFKTNNPYGYGRVITKGKYVESVIEHINASKIQKKISLCNSGVMLCNSNLLFKDINKISNKNIKKEKYLPDIFSIFYKNDQSFSFILGSEEEMLGINNISNFIDLDIIFQKKIKDKIIKNGVIIFQPDSVRVSHDVIIKQGSIIEPFVVIKPGVVIKENVLIKSHTVLEKCIINRDSSIGPNARIRPDSKIGENVKIGNYVEIKNSTIGNNSSISHLSYIGDTNLGKNVNIGAGTITCNYNGKKKNKTVIENKVFIGSNCSLIAPVKIGANSTIGAGSVITKDIPKNHLAIERSELKIFKKKGKK